MNLQKYKQQIAEKTLRFFTSLASLLCVLFALVVFWVIGKEAFAFFHSMGFWTLFVGEWQPHTGQFNLSPMIIGTLAATALGIAISAPLGIALGAFCSFYAPPIVARFIRLVLALLSGIPSVVIGLFSLSTLVPFLLLYRPPGLSLLAGAIVLALMTLPTIGALSDAAFQQVEQAPLLGGYALGLSRCSVVYHIATKQIQKTLRGAVLLAIGRALGEAMAVLMVMGNVSQIPRSLFDPARTLTMLIASEMDEALGTHRGALFAAAFLLLISIGLLSFLLPRRDANA